MKTSFYKKCVFSLLAACLLTERLSASSEGDSPQIVVSDNLTAISVWESFQSGSKSIMAATFFVGTWSSQTQLSADTCYAANPLIAISPSSGNAVVIWYATDLNTGNNVIQAAQYNSESTSWSAPATLSLNDGSEMPNMSYKVAIGEDESFTMVAAWSSYIGTASVVRSSYAYLGEPWSAAVTLSN